MTDASAPYIFVTAATGLLTFFLIRFWYLVDEIRKDLKSVLIQEAKREQIVFNLKEDIVEYKVRQQEHEKKVNFLQREIERLKQ